MHTARARENFPITGTTIAAYPHLVEALASVKEAAARANAELGLLSPGIADAICAACREIREGALHGEFVVDGNLREVEWVDLLSEIKVPMLVIVGDHDESDPVMSREMNAKIAGSKLVVLPDSGHMTFIDQPDRFIQAIRDFA